MESTPLVAGRSRLREARTQFRRGAWRTTRRSLGGFHPGGVLRDRVGEPLLRRRVPKLAPAAFSLHTQ